MTDQTKGSVERVVEHLRASAGRVLTVEEARDLLAALADITERKRHFDLGYAIVGTLLRELRAVTVLHRSMLEASRGRIQ